jgi:predicted TIM-barrel fold metal-dependent hydrolase
VILDAHCHVWPDELAPRILAGNPAGLQPTGDGTVSGLLRTMDAAGIDAACALAVANQPEHVATTNRFIGGIPRDRLIPFGTVHTGLDIEENLRSLEDNGIRAVKFHPNFQRLSLVDPAVVQLMAALAAEGIVVLVHTGRGDDAAASERGAPQHVAALLEQVPDLTLIACHYGGFHHLDGARAQVLGSRALIDTSWPPSLALLGTDVVRDLVRTHGAGRVVFASDWPMADPGTELAAIKALELTPEEESAVLGGTLAATLGLTTKSGGSTT